MHTPTILPLKNTERGDKRITEVEYVERMFYFRGDTIQVRIPSL